MRSIIKRRISRHIQKHKIKERTSHSLETTAQKSTFFSSLRISVHVDKANPVDIVYLEFSKLLMEFLP